MKSVSSHPAMSTPGVPFGRHSADGSLSPEAAPRLGAWRVDLGPLTRSAAALWVVKRGDEFLRMDGKFTTIRRFRTKAGAERACQQANAAADRAMRSGCYRSHPHELMNAECTRITELTREAFHLREALQRIAAEDHPQGYFADIARRALATANTETRVDDLLAACNRALAVIGSLHSDGTDPYVMEAETSIRAAIAKATGG